MSRTGELGQMTRAFLARAAALLPYVLWVVDVIYFERHGFHPAIYTLVVILIAYLLFDLYSRKIWTPSSAIPNRHLREFLGILLMFGLLFAYPILGYWLQGKHPFQDWTVGGLLVLIPEFIILIIFSSLVGLAGYYLLINPVLFAAKRIVALVRSHAGK